MERLEGCELMGLVEKGEVVAEQFPVERLAGAAGVLDELVDVAPIAIGTCGVVAGGLDFQANEILGVDDGDRAIGGQGEAFGAIQHAEGGRAEGVEQVDTSRSGFCRGVVGDVFRVKRAAIAEGFENGVAGVEVVRQEDEIRVEGGPLNSAQRHGEPADQGVAQVPCIKLCNERRQCGGEVHGEDGNSEQ